MLELETMPHGIPAGEISKVSSSPIGGHHRFDVSIETTSVGEKIVKKIKTPGDEQDLDDQDRRHMLATLKNEYEVLEYLNQDPPISGVPKPEFISGKLRSIDINNLANIDLNSHAHDLIKISKVPGTSLSELLKPTANETKDEKVESLTPSETFLVVTGVATILKRALHEKSLIHQDIKPDNIIVDVKTLREFIEKQKGNLEDIDLSDPASYGVYLIDWGGARRCYKVPVVEGDDDDSLFAELDAQDGIEKQTAQVEKVNFAEDISKKQKTPNGQAYSHSEDAATELEYSIDPNHKIIWGMMGLTEIHPKASYLDTGLQRETTRAQATFIDKFHISSPHPIQDIYTLIKILVDSSGYKSAQRNITDPDIVVRQRTMNEVNEEISEIADYIQPYTQNETISKKIAKAFTLEPYVTTSKEGNAVIVNGYHYLKIEHLLNDLENLAKNQLRVEPRS